MQRQERLDPARASHGNTVHRDDCSSSPGYVRETILHEVVGIIEEQARARTHTDQRGALPLHGGLFREGAVVDFSCVGCGKVELYDGKEDAIFVRSADMMFSQDIFQKYVRVTQCAS